MGSEDFSLKTMIRIREAELNLFQLQFKLRSERTCSFLWRPDADYRQCSPISTEVWAHWEMLVKNQRLVVKQEKQRTLYEKSCCSIQHRDLHHYDLDLHQASLEEIFDEVEDQEFVPNVSML